MFLIKPALSSILLYVAMASVQAQTLVALDDNYGIPFRQTLLVEALGILENDTLDGESAGESGAVAELISGPQFGVMQCPSNVSLALCPDGSFDYTPDANFPGTDSFVYQTVAGAVMDSATVTLTACTGGPQIYSCWHESSYLTLLTEFGYATFWESFEGDGWDVTRYPDSATSVTSQGILWTTNYPDTNKLTTGTGPARSGLYGMWDSQHGFAVGSPSVCDVDAPPLPCLYYDGFSGLRVAEEDELHGVSGYISGRYSRNISIILDGTTEINFGQVGAYGHQFMGVLDVSVAGFRSYEFREVEGKIGQSLYIWADDFTFAIEPPLGNTIPVAQTGSAQAVLAGETVVLDGSESRDVDDDPLSYRWSFVSQPPDGYAVFDLTDPVHPTFVTEFAGTYLVQLIVNDATIDSAPDTVVITAGCSGEVVTVSNAIVPFGITECVGSTSIFVGPNVMVDSGAELQLDGPSIGLGGDVKIQAGGILRVQLGL